MKLRACLPSAGWSVFVLISFGTGAAIAYVADSPVEPQFVGSMRGPLPIEMGVAHCAVLASAGQSLAPEDMKAYEEARPPLWDNLGALSWPISTKSPDAQKYFDQGLRLAANFNHAEARRSFRRAQSLDPDCAMCFLGEALILGPNINVPMDPAANAPAIAALSKAQTLSSGATEKERGLMGAVAKRYSDDPSADRNVLNAAFADATAALSDKYPDDLEIAALAAEAGMDTQPWDYWQPGGKEPKGRTADIQRRLENILAKKPDHPMAIHLYIHLVEASDRPERAEPYADRLAALMPGAGHIVHMPSHIYYRVGRYADSLKSNEAASKVDEAYLAETGAVGVYPLGYYAHNVHFVLVSAQLLGDRKTVLAEADKLDNFLTNEVATALPIVQPVKAAPYFAWAQYAEPDVILAKAEPPGAPPYIKAIWHYARGVALAEKKDGDAARAEADAIQKIATDTDWSVHEAWGIPARSVRQVAEDVVRARAAQAQNDIGGSIDFWKKAAETEDTIPYMEPPYWYYPVRQSLGAALLQGGQPAEAATQFRAALDRARNSAWALFGLQQATKAQGDTAAEAKAAEELSKVWEGDPGMLTLEGL
jgi:tetratricopeptide (TPR) repeat protein